MEKPAMLVRIPVYIFHPLLWYRWLPLPGGPGNKSVQLSSKTFLIV